MHMIALSYNSAKIQHLKTVVVELELMRFYVAMNGVHITVIGNSLCERRHHGKVYGRDTTPELS